VVAPIRLSTKITETKDRAYFISEIIPLGVTLICASCATSAEVVLRQ
jgi:hypothetical protein